MTVLAIVLIGWVVLSVVFFAGFAVGIRIERAQAATR